MAGNPISHGGVKTYWHLQAQRRIPTDYEIASTQLLYYRTHGFAVDTPAAAWMRDNGADADLRCDDWDGFADPATMTYKDYVSSRRDRETVVASALRIAQENEPNDWSRHDSLLTHVLAPMRYCWHGLQMASAYLAHLAPGSRIVIAALFQTADLLRGVDALTRRIGVGPGTEARARWEDDAFWQPTREMIERLLVTYRWSECFVALNLAIKPTLEEWLLRHLSELARTNGDDATRLLLWSLHEDALWHRAWTTELCARLTQDADNRSVIVRALTHWRAQTEPVEASFEALFREEFSARYATVTSTRHALLSAAGLEDI